MAIINQHQWDKYRKVLNQFSESASTDEVEWFRWREKPSRHGEDETYLQKPIVLKGLMQYNFFRAWPLTGYTITGEYDLQSTMLLLNVQYLVDLGLTNEHRKLIYRQDKDLFKHRGDLYLPTGDTFVSQAGDTPVLFMLILKRQENHPYPNIEVR